MSQRSTTPTPLAVPATPRETSFPSTKRALQCWTVLALLASSLQAGNTLSLTTTFASDNGSTGNMFDIAAIRNCVITDLDCNFSSGTVNYEIYTTANSYVGNEATAAAWTLIANGTVVSNGIDLPTPLQANLGLSIPAGQSLGIYVAVSNSAVLKYTNGPGTGIAATNIHMTVSEGIGIAYPFSTTFAPRVWNGTVHYEADTGSPFCFGDGSGLVCPCGNFGGFERGCGNSVGPGARLVGSGGASLATDNLRFTLDGMSSNRPGLLISGTANFNGGSGVYFGDGLSCVGGSMVSFGVRYSDSGGLAGWGQNILSRGAFPVGSTQYFQVVYREMNYPCGTGFNTSNGVALTVEP